MPDPPPLPREHFPVVARWAYLNHAGVSPMPRRAAGAMAAYAEGVSLDGGERWEAHEACEGDLRAALGRLMGVPADGVAFVKNTTEGLGLVADGLDWAPGDRVAVATCEFPSNLYPWAALRSRGVEMVPVAPAGRGERVTAEAFEPALRAGGVRVVAVSWVQYGRGWRCDLAALGRLCREHGALLVVDAIQGVGLLPAEFEAWGVDVAAGDGYKWLLGPEGTGFVYVGATARERIRPTRPGWNSVAHRGDFENPSTEPDAGARRYEGGTANYAGAYALAESVRLIESVGTDAVWAHVDALCMRLDAGLQAAGAEVLTDRSDGGASGIVTFALGHEAPERTAQRLLDAGVAVRARGGGVRAAPHGYSSEDDVDRLLGVLGG